MGSLLLRLEATGNALTYTGTEWRSLEPDSVVELVGENLLNKGCIIPFLPPLSPKASPAKGLIQHGDLTVSSLAGLSPIQAKLVFDATRKCI